MTSILRFRLGTKRWATILVPRTRFYRCFKTFLYITLSFGGHNFVKFYHICYNIPSNLDMFVGQKNPIKSSPVFGGGAFLQPNYWYLGPRGIILEKFPLLTFGMVCQNVYENCKPICDFLARLNHLYKEVSVLAGSSMCIVFTDNFERNKLMILKDK